MHSYRRGGRTHVSRRRAHCLRAATKAEITEHGRWRQRNQGHEAMALHYCAPTLEDRLYISLLCM
jgi:hypothetical protein